MASDSGRRPKGVVASFDSMSSCLVQAKKTCSPKQR
jgi:hypothetical protein